MFVVAAVTADAARAQEIAEAECLDTAATEISGDTTKRFVDQPLKSASTFDGTLIVQGTFADFIDLDKQRQAQQNRYAGEILLDGAGLISGLPSTTRPAA